jgi:uncharacterized protein YwqG
MPFDFWKRWTNPKKPNPDPPPRDIKRLLASSIRPAAHLIAGGVAPHTSWLGSTPDADAPRNLTLVACIDLAELQRKAPIEWLPSDGSLSFYYDVEEQPWGFDPSDRKGFEVVWSAGRRTPPDSGSALVKGITFKTIATYPEPANFEDLGITLTPAEDDLYWELCESTHGEFPNHQMGGWPDSVQGPMALECQLVSNGIYCGGPEGYRDPRAQTLRAGAAEWKLLLQLGVDDDLEWMWGDLGSVYFLIKESDARQRDFSKAWCILQCH